jgi:Uma2 family endonuclease
MIIAAPEPKTRLQPVGEQRVVLRDLSWQAYRTILETLSQGRSSRLTYDDGVLEITVPLEDHEFATRLIERFIITLAELLGLPVKTMGSTTLNYPELRKGAEPDNAYYFQNQRLVKGRNVNFSVDPPPDLVVEVDITHTDIAKNQFYASLGVPEFWRFDGQVLRIYQLESRTLESGTYIELEYSPLFPQVSKEQLYQFLAQAKEDEIGAMVSLRAWWTEQTKT